LTGPIAVICALEMELAHVRSRLTSEADVALVVSGVGMVSAAAAAQDTISRYAPRAVINYGCAGAHRLDLLPGDLVVGERVVAYESYRESTTGELEYNGMYYVEEGEQRHVDSLVCDAALVSAAHRVAALVGDGHEPWPVALGWPDSVAHRAPRVVFGTVASADRWNRAPASISALVARHDSLCEDMEAAAIGLVCASHGVPFLTIKDISNNELLRGTAGWNRLVDEIGSEQIARRAAAFTFGVIRELGPSSHPSPQPLSQR
jgi:adenosylhomocysteine nucleosidase